jgi:chromosomal replication initiator protein
MNQDGWNYEVFWKEAISQIQQQLSEQEYLMWFRNMEYVTSADSRVEVSVPSSFYRDQVRQRYQKTIERKLLELSGHGINLDFRVDKREVPPPPAAKDKSGKSGKAAPTVHKSKRPHGQLNGEYNFERFVRGDNNDFAYMAAYAIAKNPGKAYNPCMIYGGVGLGKTHLLQAIGNSAHREFDGIKIVYVTAETFTNEFILSIKENSSHRFKNKYRSVDMLLIDDVHFLPGKVETQEELFHTFNALYDAPWRSSRSSRTACAAVSSAD